MSPEEFAEHVRTSVDPKWVRPGAAVDEILSVERRLRMRLSDEMRAFYGCVGGTDEPTPLEEGWMTFWPLERWDRAATFTKNSDADLVVVADHSLSSWWYAIPSAGGVETPVLVVDGLRPPRVVAPSFSAFAEAVFNDDRSIYPQPIALGAG